jgi:NTP pyrophosphatase (non-canonical NTP hydrolase)
MYFQQLIEQARAIRSKYADLERSKYGREWSGEELMLGFVGDVGDLVKIVQAKEGIRGLENVDEALAHELSDCLWSVIILADKYNIDLEKAFAKTMDDLDNRLSG